MRLHRPRATRAVALTLALLISSAAALRPTAAVRMASTISTPPGTGLAAPAGADLLPVSKGAVSGGAIKSSALWKDSGALIFVVRRPG